jgi:hypothetical protein
MESSPTGQDVRHGLRSSTCLQERNKKGTPTHYARYVLCPPAVATANCAAFSSLLLKFQLGLLWRAHS